MADAPTLSTPRTTPRTMPRPTPYIIAGGIAGIGAIAVLTGTFSLAALQNFVVIFSSLLIGVVPLVMMGALVGAGIGTFVPASAFARLSELPEPLQIPAAGIAGFAFPVCECGSVPVARRLVERGLTPSAAVTFMLAAPILNPIVLVSTALAYQGRATLLPMVLGRAGLGLVAAIAVGWVVGGRKGAATLKPAAAADTSATCGCGDDGCNEDDHEHVSESRWATFFGHFCGDFAYMGRFLVLGTAVAAALQTLLPQSFLGPLASTPVFSLVAMMGLAFALSLCSESDAFVAASFVQFGPGAQLAFLVFGPMVDAKLAFLYSATFSKGFFRLVLLVVTGITLAGGLWFELMFG